MTQSDNWLRDAGARAKRSTNGGFVVILVKATAGGPGRRCAPRHTD
jgi:hypothetical protein